MPSSYMAVIHAVERRLIDLRRVRLMGVSTAVRSRHRDVDGTEDRDRCMHHGALKYAVATYARAVVSRRNSTGAA